MKDKLVRTISQLKDQRLIATNDIVLIANDCPNLGAFVLKKGTAGKDITLYVMTFNDMRITLFEIDKKTDKFTGNITNILLCDIDKLTINTILSKDFVLATHNRTYHFYTAKVLYGIDQSRSVNEALAFLKKLA